MEKFVKKPVTIEAVQIPNFLEPLDIDITERLTEYSITGYKLDYNRQEFHLLTSNLNVGEVVALLQTDYSTSSYDILSVAVATKTGVVYTEPESWLIRGIDGEIYPCTDEVFKSSHTSVRDIPKEVPKELNNRELYITGGPGFQEEQKKLGETYHEILEILFDAAGIRLKQITKLGATPESDYIAFTEDDTTIINDLETAIADIALDQVSDTYKNENLKNKVLKIVTIRERRLQLKHLIALAVAEIQRINHAESISQSQVQQD